MAPLIRDTLYADSPVQKYSDDSVRQALTVGLATLIGGAAGALLGTDATSAALAAQNEALNNATSLGPARGALAQENARLTKQCEPSCTRADFDRIDTEVRTLEANLALARMDNLTPEQALRLADTLSNLLPYYGSAAMLYQAVTGQTLSGQELGTADRWLSGILGAIPAGAAAYGKISEFVAARGVVDTGVQWGKGIVGQGMPWEDYLATKMPAGSRLPPNFKTFDFYDEATGIATSAKTLDTTTAAKIANPAQVYSSLKGNIDAAANFTQARLGSTVLREQGITARELQVAIPAGTTPAQWQQIGRAIQYGQSQGVKVTITVVR